jgi:transposase
MGIRTLAPLWPSKGIAFTEDAAMAQFDVDTHALVGPNGSLSVREDDEVTRKLLMLMEGECEESGPLQAAIKFGFSKQRYFQLRTAFNESGSLALQNQKRGPKTKYRQTAEMVRQVIRHRFLDGDASAEVIAQKLRQTGSTISNRTVERIIAEYGLQKKTPQIPPRRGARKGRGPNHQ